MKFQMKEEKIAFTVRLDPPQLEKLQARQRETGVGVSELIRRAIDAALTESVAKWPKVKR